ncbi:MULTISPECIES: dephospho-CoA kinase [Leptolyngbya]|jgi:dephospho-CoA kinase|uniref:Dephospho-CoA kinase n=1 Tax=Leptolyngbya boryana NIES-2135 TaxID=1973484 RepID=A0A1Z4JQL2_LEPBY|nr:MULTISPECIES: dephospho-CoA kinase [Leptolyngbya]BAY58999.1 dephospho-CoA kinase [Leptolyngbya boryana NIES-2135]MBD2368250.1 dephospho-CoA kinase [Leptolyngbya sp. FACHB-161]MBD2374710.1 dephospho-CoA kinase [Leptolyngbya sp. FACHB-238]MBD2399132.1 dephospho-CoA kinase [Leptolyngbya sp. FACHB-239]MBD2405138.1 dephospho-CoA kinase [Leptolyngbya sp. FACHB-402]
MRVIGITGGIAMGKTTVSNYLATTYHFPIVDADLVAREAVAVGSPILSQIVDRYGSKLIRLDGTLDRSRLGAIIFADPIERAWLEQQIHPYVRKVFETERDRATVPTVFVIPLLFEAQMTDLVTEIWVITCSEQQQIQRLMQREKLSLEQAKARIQSQMPIQEKCDRATVVLENSTSLEALLKQVDQAVDRLS